MNNKQPVFTLSLKEPLVDHAQILITQFSKNKKQKNNSQLFCCKKQAHVYFICSCDLNMVYLGIGNSPLLSFSVLFVLVFFQHSKHARITPLSLSPLSLAPCHIWRPAIDRGVCDHVATCDSFG